jgi:hypothetical protein
MLSSFGQLQKAGLLNKGSTLVAALGVTKFITTIVMHSVTLCCAA